MHGATVKISENSVVLAK